MPQDDRAGGWAGRTVHQAGAIRECVAVGYAEVPPNADHLLVSVLAWVMLAFLAKMEILATPDIRAVLLAVSSISSSGDVCSQRGRCPVSRSE